MARRRVGQAGSGRSGGGGRAGSTASATRVLRSSISTSISLRTPASAHGYTWLRLHLQWAGVVPKARRKGAHRRKRERRPLPGNHAASEPALAKAGDGSRHEWLDGCAPLDPIVTLDDATGRSIRRLPPPLAENRLMASQVAGICAILPTGKSRRFAPTSKRWPLGAFMARRRLNYVRQSTWDLERRVAQLASGLFWFLHLYSEWIVAGGSHLVTQVSLEDCLPRKRRRFAGRPMPLA
jgi:hypothetical protein